MNDDLQALFGKYVEFFTCLYESAGGPAGIRKSECHKGFDEFCRLWQRWGRTPGLQELWRRRFEQGYDETVKSFLAHAEPVILSADFGRQASKSHRAAA